MATDAPDWTGKQTVTIDTSGGAVGVSIDGQTSDLTVKIDTSGGAVAVSQQGTVTVAPSGTFNVQGVAGGTAIGVQVNNTADVNVTGASATLDVQFPSAQDVTINSDAPVQVSNPALPTNPGYQGKTFTQTISIAAGGGTQSFNSGAVLAVGTYDAVWMYVSSAQGNINNYTFELLWTALISLGLITQSVETNFIAAASNNDIWISKVMYLSDPVMFDNLAIQVTSSVAIDDTLTIIIFARQMSVGNPPAAPANIQPGQGSWDTQAAFSQSGLNNQTATLLSAGGQIKTLYLSYGIVATSAGTVEITQNGTIIDRILVGANSSLYEHELIQLSPDGVTLSGTGIQIVVPNGMTVAVSGYGTYASSTPPSRVGLIV